MYLLGFVVAWWLGRRRVRAGRLPGVDENGFGDLMFYGMLGVVLGGRIGYILFYDFGAFVDNPLMLFKVWEGGMSFHGGLLGVLVAVAWWSRRQRLHFFDTVDFVAPLVPAGLGFGRLGNFIGGELWGKPTQGTAFDGWGVIFPRSLPEPFASMDAATLKAQFDAGIIDSFARHPSQLYQATLEGAGDVRRAGLVFAQAAPALCGLRRVRAAVRHASASWWNSCASRMRSSATSPSAG